MADNNPGSRRYSDEEIARILDRAAELESDGAPRASQAGGMSLAEIQEIGREAGLDVTLLRQAAHEIDMGIAPVSKSRPNRFLGAPSEMQLEREVIGELDEEGFERLVPMIQMAADGMGHASVIGRTLTWQSKDAQNQRPLSIAVSSRDGRTRIVINENYGNMAGGLFGGLMAGLGGGMGFGVGMGVGLGALGSAAFATVFPIAAVGGSYLLARTIYVTTVRKRQRVLGDLLDRVAQEVEAVTERQIGAEKPPELPGPSS